LTSDWPFVGDFYWTYKQSTPRETTQAIGQQHTSPLRPPTTTGFLVSGFCFWVFAVTSTKSSHPAPTHQSPASYPRMYVSTACLYCPLLDPSHLLRAALPTRPLLEYHAAVVPNHAANPPPSCRPLGQAQLAHSIFHAPPLSGGIGSRQQKQRLRAPRRRSAFNFQYAPLLLAPAHPSRLATNM